MKKLANPFDSFTDEHTPIDFAVCSWIAVKWLMPYLNYNNKSHVQFVMDCEEYSDFIDQIGTPVDGTITLKQRDTILDFQTRIDHGFQKIWTTEVANELSRMAIKLSKAQSERASKPRKDSTQNWEGIAKRYLELKQGGYGYGLVAHLANEYDITPQTVRNLAKKYKEKTIAK
jgi:hypothetical protein